MTESTQRQKILWILGTILVLAMIGLALNFVVARAEAILLRWKGEAT